MNVVDEVELDALTATGDVELAEFTGQIVKEHFERIAWLFGISVDELFKYLDMP